MSIALIPARGGSKRVPHKNVRDFHGKPMLAWPILAAQESGCFDRIVVSTDDAQIAQVAKACGAEVPFLRPAALSDDHATIAQVMQHAISALDAKDDVCCIYATAPLLAPEYIKRGQQLLAGSDFAISVTTYPAPIQQALRVAADGLLQPFSLSDMNTRSQDLVHAYHDAAQFCWGSAEAWLSGRPVFGDRTRAVIIPRYRVQDIDTEEDLLMVTALFSALSGAPALKAR